MKLRTCAQLLLSCGLIVSHTLYAKPSHMIPLSESDLSQVQGQALMNLSYLAPADTGNHESANNMGFYKLGLEADIAVNLNIKKLQLGCGGANGANGCDIDIDNLSLSGNSSTRDGRVASDAILKNPFIEFAIKNPNSASTREVSGFRVSAEQAIGLLTAGTQNSTTPNGINTISGFMRIQSDSSGYIYGKANTAPTYLDANQHKITGQVQVSGAGGLLTLSIETNGGGLTIPSLQRVPFIRPGIVLNQNRVSSLALQAVLNVPDIYADHRGVYPAGGEVIYGNPVESPLDWGFTTPQRINVQGGELKALITDCEGLGCLLTQTLGPRTGQTLNNVFLKGRISGIKADATINQGLGYIHSLPINTPFYLSLQNQALRWPGTYSGPNPERTNVNGSINTSVAATVTDVAQKGWWMSFADPINLGSVDPTQPLDISPLFPELVTRVSDQIDRRRNPNAQYIQIGLDGALAAIAGTGDVPVTINNPILLTNPLGITLNDLQLDGQNFAPNCYGGLTFC